MEELLRQLLEKLDSIDKRLEHLEKFQSEWDTQSFEHIQQHLSIIEQTAILKGFREEYQKQTSVSRNNEESIVEILAILTNSLTEDGLISPPHSGKSIPEVLARIESQVWALRKKNT
jgi:hypothetical protein